jgi:outer membrane protein assembly factor BamE (lipoprotein component of BamABCDE complex)
MVGLKWWWGLLAMVLVLAACDPQNIAELEEGMSTEADVRARFGEPENIWDAPGGGRTLEYNRQPAGYQNYMITIGPDGKMSALRQVLTPANFAKVTPGMMMEDVRRMLGKPMRISHYELKRETHYDWRYHDGPNASDARVFTVVFDSDLRVLSTGSVSDPELHGDQRR